MKQTESGTFDSLPLDLWSVWRTDDNGNSFILRERVSRLEAEQIVEVFAATGHKQIYWIERKGTDG